MRTNLNEVSAFMDKFGYNDFKKKLYYGILNCLSFSVRLASTDDIVCDYTGADKRINVSFVGVDETVRITMSDTLMHLEYFVRNREWEEIERNPDYLWCDFRDEKYYKWKDVPYPSGDRRNPVDDIHVWDLAIFDSEDRYRESYLREYEKAPGTREEHVELAREILSFALSDGLNIDDECEWLA